MASALFEVSNTYIDPRNHVDSKACCYRALIVAFSLLHGATGGATLIKAVFVRSAAAALHTLSPFADIIWHTTHATIAVGVFMAFLGVIGASCTSIEGMVLYFILAVPVLMLEIGVAGALVAFQSEITTHAETSAKCEECHKFIEDLEPLIPIASAVLLCFAICQVFILCAVVRFIFRLRQLSNRLPRTDQGRYSLRSSRRSSIVVTRRMNHTSSQYDRNVETSMMEANRSQPFSFRVYNSHKSDSSSSGPGSSTPKNRSAGSTLRLSHSILSAITPSTIRSNQSQQSNFLSPLKSQHAPRSFPSSNLFGTSRKKKSPTKPKYHIGIVPKVVIDEVTSSSPPEVVQQSQMETERNTLASCKNPTPPSITILPQDGDTSGNQKEVAIAANDTSGSLKYGVATFASIVASGISASCPNAGLNDDEHTPDVERARSSDPNCEWHQGIPLTPMELPVSPISPPPPPPPTPKTPSPSNNCVTFL